MNNSEGSTYRSYLLRLWRDNPRAPWQASLQSTATEQIYYFVDVDQMWAFLKAKLGTDPDDQQATDAPPGESEDAPD